MRRHFKLQTTLSHCKYCFPQLLYVIPYPADMSGAKAAKHHDRVLCHSGFFVAQFSSTSIKSTNSHGSLTHFISSQPKAPRPPCSCFGFGRRKSIRQRGFQVKQPSTTLIQQIKRHQATSSDATRQIRQIRHHSGGLFVVRLWTRRLQRCVGALDAVQVLWLRSPCCAAVCLCVFSTFCISRTKTIITAHYVLHCIINRWH